MGVYEYLEKYEEAQREAPEALNEIHILFTSPGSQIPEGQLLLTHHPKMDRHTAELVIRISMVILYASLSYINKYGMVDDADELKNIHNCNYILSLATEMEPWIR
nr:hypothetical protein [Tanacetum cinerariifolium]